MASATIAVTRRSGFEWTKGPFDILFDGKTVGSVSKGQTVELQVEPGRHTLQVRLGRRASLERTFNAADGQIINFSSQGTWILGQYLFSPGRPGVGVKLNEE